MYHNTTEETQVDLFQDKTVKQDGLVLKAFANSEKPLGASDINIGAPITSVRRSINTLFREGLINRVGKKLGRYNRPEYTYEAGVL